MSKATRLLNISQRIPSHMKEKYRYPGADQDMLFVPDYEHKQQTWPTQLQAVPSRKASQMKNPFVYGSGCSLGTILSAIKVLEHGRTRRELGEKYDALCIEMEVAGLMNQFLLRGNE